MSVDRTGLDKGLEAAKSTFQAWEQGIAALGAAIAAGGASITAPFLGALGEFASWDVDRAQEPSQFCALR